MNAPNPVFDASLVRIERDRHTVTQGSFSIYYAGELLDVYGDDIRFIGGTGPNKCWDIGDVREGDGRVVVRRFAGYSDAEILEFARRAVEERASSSHRGTIGFTGPTTSCERPMLNANDHSTNESNPAPSEVYPLVRKGETVGTMTRTGAREWLVHDGILHVAVVLHLDNGMWHIKDSRGTAFPTPEQAGLAALGFYR